MFVLCLDWVNLSVRLFISIIKHVVYMYMYLLYWFRFIVQCTFTYIYAAVSLSEDLHVYLR